MLCPDGFILQTLVLSCDHCVSAAAIQCWQPLCSVCWPVTCQQVPGGLPTASTDVFVHLEQQAVCSAAAKHGCYLHPVCCRCTTLALCVLELR